MTTGHSIKSMSAAALFGINLDDHDHAAPHPELDASKIASSIKPGAILHITGPSGAGKSTLLRGLTKTLKRRGDLIIDAQRLEPDEQPCVDCFPGSIESALAAIASAGLAEARCFLRTPGQLSDGERFRLRLAIALHRARAVDPRHIVIVIDEFAATLDRPTARSVSRLLRHGVNTSNNISAITITSHDDLDGALSPDQWLHLDHYAAHDRSPGHDPELRRDIILETGNADDYRALSRWHYRPGDPVAPVRLLRLRHTALNQTIGVLVVAMPTLNSTWRHLAWPGRYATGDKRADAMRINREIRRVARVIIDPRFRGLGLAHRLVRAYLDDPLTPCTEAAAVMGAVSAFFERAGMSAYTTPPSARNARLLDALDHLGFHPYELASPIHSYDRVRATPADASLIDRELRRWAGASRSSARHTSDDTNSLWRRACRSITGVPIGYAHTSDH